MAKYDRLHDVVFEVCDVSLKDEQLERLFFMLPASIRAIAAAWGMDDTEFGDEAYRYIEEHPQLVKGL